MTEWIQIGNFVFLIEWRRKKHWWNREPGVRPLYYSYMVLPQQSGDDE